jgi:hypothetical protein
MKKRPRWLHEEGWQFSFNPDEITKGEAKICRYTEEGGGRMFEAFVRAEFVGAFEDAFSAADAVEAKLLELAGTDAP